MLRYMLSDFIKNVNMFDSVILKSIFSSVLTFLVFIIGINKGQFNGI